MGQLYTWGKLTKEQEVAFGELLWSKLNEDTQLPDLEQYYFFVFMKWPQDVYKRQLMKCTVRFLQNGYMN